MSAHAEAAAQVAGQLPGDGPGLGVGVDGHVRLGYGRQQLHRGMAFSSSTVFGSWWRVADTAVAGRDASPVATTGAGFATSKQV